MKTLIFLNRNSYHRYNFAELPELQAYRMVAIVDQEYFSKFPEQQKKYFSKIYEVPTQSSKVATLDFILDYDATCAIVDEEINRAAGPHNVLIICGDESNVSLVGKLRDRYHIEGDGEKQLDLYRDKTLMKQCLQKHHIRVPFFVHFDCEAAQRDPESYFHHLVKQVKLPFIIKPLTGMAGLFTYKIHHIKDYLDKISSLLAQPHSYEVEEFITGKLYHIDTVAQNKQLLTQFCSEYFSPLLDFQKGKIVGSIPLLENSPLDLQLKQLNLNILMALGITNGASHMEIFCNDQQELIFLEVGSRPPGLFVSENYQRAYGYNIYNQDLLAQLGLNNKFELPIKTYSLWFVIPTKTGRVIQLLEPNTQGTCELTWLVKKGDVLDEKAQSIFDYIGHGFVTHPEYNKLYADFELLRNFNFIRTEEL